MRGVGPARPRQTKCKSILGASRRLSSRVKGVARGACKPLPRDNMSISPSGIYESRVRTCMYNNRACARAPDSISRREILEGSSAEAWYLMFNCEAELRSNEARRADIAKPFCEAIIASALLMREMLQHFFAKPEGRRPQGWDVICFANY